VTTLTELYHEGGEAKHFAEEFAHRVHAGDWDLAKNHWTQTVEHIANRAKELEDLAPRVAARKAERIARTLCLNLAQADTCWACRSQATVDE